MKTPRMRTYAGEALLRLPQVQRLPRELRDGMRVVIQVLPFKVNQFVVEELIDWERVPEDPIFRLTFPHPDMLAPEVFAAVADLVRSGAPREVLRAAVARIRLDLNPHPAGQLELNVPVWRGERLRGLQHKYRETVLFFPAQGQTCHAYCGYCFRWAQFVGMPALKQMERRPEVLYRYLEAHPEVTDLLLTGGDPLVMRTAHLRRYLEPFLRGAAPHVTSIRIGTKALTYWPFRFTTDPDAEELLRLFEALRAAGRHVALMVHVTHPRELEPEPVRRAVGRLQAAGVLLRTQAPLVRHVNAAAEVWARKWRAEVRLGMVPYYMFVERDTGARRYYEVPLAEAYRIYRRALRRVSGLARTVRGPSMSATPGKVVVDGVAEIGTETVFCLRFLQARNPFWVDRPFFARYDPRATWLDQLRPAFGARRFFFETDPVKDWRRGTVTGRTLA